MSLQLELALACVLYGTESYATKPQSAVKVGHSTPCARQDPLLFAEDNHKTWALESDATAIWLKLGVQVASLSQGEEEGGEEKIGTCVFREERMISYHTSDDHT